MQTTPDLNSPYCANHLTLHFNISDLLMKMKGALISFPIITYQSSCGLPTQSHLC